MSNTNNHRKDHIHYINLKLASLGYEPVIFSNKNLFEDKFITVANNLIESYRVKSRLLSDYYCPADQRIQDFIKRYFSDVDCIDDINFPHKSFILDKPGIARELSLPPNKNKFIIKELNSYRIKQGILHNPLHDRRTTIGTFHIAEGGLPVPIDKKEIPKIAFANLFRAACQPPKRMMLIPFTASSQKPSYSFISLLLRPIVSPEVKKIMKEKRMEIRFFVPGSFVSNLDFVESIFGNAGNPYLTKNDAGLDIGHWTGHSGCIILAPHLINCKKQKLGLPHYDKATERQRKDGMCWKDEDELYNNGSPFKATCRDETGVVITLIADNYFGYSKKEIKTQISYSANLMGIVEEEHAGGAVAFPRKNIGTSFRGIFFDKKMRHDYTFEEIKKNYISLFNLQSDNYGIDKMYKNIIYIPEYANIGLNEGKVWWTEQRKRKSLPLLPNHYYVLPSGYKIHLEKHPSAPSWRLVSTGARGTFCHKPCTVSGGGKSEISKSLLNAIIYGPFFIHDINEDFKLANKVINYNYSKRFIDPPQNKPIARPLLSPKRTLGSAIKLLTPSDTYTKEYNEFLNSIPPRIKALTLFVKRFYRPNIHKKNWKHFFTVDIINGRKGKELIFEQRRIIASYLRIGFANDNTWFLHKLRADFLAAAKIQMEDDITASITLPTTMLENIDSSYNQSVKLTVNCESRFFQRPDEAIHRGYDKETEAHLSMRGNFTSNYEPLTAKDAQDLINDTINFDLYTKPIQKLIKRGASDTKGHYFITPSHPRIVDGTRTKNPRYLQIRPDIVNPIDDYLADIGTRFSMKIPLEKPVHYPVDAILPGRRNNPPDKVSGIRPLSVYNPIHYQELPELFMDFICSLTGRSPSTTGAGSEGALTKGPFNMLLPTTDLNNALLSYILTGYEGFSSAAGYIGTENRFDHDISLLIPEIWCRMEVEERNPKKLIEEGSLERINDFEYKGQKILGSRLGYRITSGFMFRYANRVFDEPQAVFTKRMLKPELQDMEAFVDGINNIVEAQQRVALNYFEDESIKGAIPPLKVLLHIMAYGHFENKNIENQSLRKLFDREYVIRSDWYQERLRRKQKIDIEFYIKQITYIKNFMKLPGNADIIDKLDIKNRLSEAKKQLKYYKHDQHLKNLVGTIGVDIMLK